MAATLSVHTSSVLRVNFNKNSFRNTVKSLAVIGKAHKMRVPYQLKEGQSRLFHELPCGLNMEVIVQKGISRDPVDETVRSKNPPLVFFHGSFHAAWCWAVHWLPFFSGFGYDCYAVSLLGQGEGDTPPFRVKVTRLRNQQLALFRNNSHTKLAGAALICSIPPSGNSYQELMKESSRMPLFNLKKLNSSLPVPSVPISSVNILIVGASNDFIVDHEGLCETARFYGVTPVCIEGVAHDIMLDCSWERGARAILSWLDSLNGQSL